MDVQSETILRSVNTELARRVRAMANALQARGIVIRVANGLRSTAKQAALYANRASNPYPVAKPGTSLHERGLAVDVAVVRGGTLAQVGAVGESLGLRWGGRFTHADPVHFELPANAVQSVSNGVSAAATVSVVANSAPATNSSAGATDNHTAKMLVFVVAVIVAGLVLRH